MTYIDQINLFWKLDKEIGFTGNESKLYFFLLDCLNSWYWTKDSFNNSDEYTASALGVSINTMKTARAKLVEVGLIEIRTGGVGRKDKCIYRVIPEGDFSGKVSDIDTFSRKSAGERYQLRHQNLTPSDNYSGQKVSIKVSKIDDNKIYNIESNIENTNTSDADASRDAILYQPVLFSDQETTLKPEDPKNLKKEKEKKVAPKKEKEPFWQQLVDTWFNYHLYRFKRKPMKFEGRQIKGLQSIICMLKAECKADGLEWSENEAIARLQAFFELAYNASSWLQKNFSPEILSSKFDVIKNNSHGTYQSNPAAKSIKDIGRTIHFDNA